MLKHLPALCAALVLASFPGAGSAGMKIHEGALELDKTIIHLSSAGTATITAKTCDQCGEVSVKIDRNTKVIGLDGQPKPDALQLGYSGGATIMYNFKSLRVTQVVLWQ